MNDKIEINLRVLMAYKKVNQKQVHEGTGISPSVISKYFNNNSKNINVNDIVKLCKYFNCTPNDLFIIK